MNDERRLGSIESQEKYQAKKGKRKWEEKQQMVSNIIYVM